MSAIETVSGTRLRGMTWDHSRAVDPLLACSRVWKERTHVEVLWDRQSLQDFEAYPLGDLARRYDLIVIDHPHIGQAATEHCLVELPVCEAPASAGPSQQSYEWLGKTFAYPIDAACQVSAMVDGAFQRAPSDWDEVADLASRGAVAWPLRAPHALVSFCTLASNVFGVGTLASNGVFVDPTRGEDVLATMQSVARHLDARSFDADPIQVLEAMAARDTTLLYSPLVFGYVSYARDGFRDLALRFTDIAAPGSNGPAGSVLGGTGIAASAMSSNRPAAIEFARWLAGAEAQSIAARNGGQPASVAVWEDETVNGATRDFYIGTRRTIEGSWVRPRHAGFVTFLEAGSSLISAALRGALAHSQAIIRLNRLYTESLSG